MFEFPELHDESIPIMAFAKAVMKLMLAAGMHDFSIRDIFKPDHQRTRRALSAIINFAWLPYYPVWGIIAIVLDIAIIWALTAHGRDLASA